MANLCYRRMIRLDEYGEGKDISSDDSSVYKCGQETDIR